MSVLEKQLDQLAADRWAYRGLRTLLRGVWLSVCVWCIALGAAMLLGWPLDLRLYGAGALVCVLLALLALLRPPLAPQTVARRLDRRYGLNETLITALEVAEQQPAPGSVAAYLLTHATRTTAGLRAQIQKRQPPPWTDFLTLLTMLLAALGLLLLSGIAAPPLPAAFAPPPALPLAAEVAPPQDQREAAGQQPGQASAGAPSAADRQTMAALADALRDQGATRPAADALDKGDPAAAAAALRQLADQAGQLSQDARDQIARQLDDAASAIGQGDPQTAAAVRDAAAQIGGSERDASRGMESLASAVEQLGKQGQQSGDGQTGASGTDATSPQTGGPSGQQQNGASQQPGAGAGAGNSAASQQQPLNQPERLGVDGKPMPLDAKGDGAPTLGDAGGAKMPGSGGTTNGGTAGSGGSTAADPLNIPMDERDVVQDYFQP